ncbi:ribose-phosphate diphosphokinase [candidate division KSB1 bacterium]
MTGDTHNDRPRIFTGNAHRQLAADIAAHIDLELGDAEVTQFSDGEVWVKINENIRGADVFVIQSTVPPARNVLELLIMIDACRRASARRITAVMPYYGYARQDRKEQSRVPISAKLMANLITAAGADRVITVDLHAGQIQGFFDIPVDHLYSAPVFSEYLKKLKLDNMILVSPDVGRADRTRSFAKRLELDMAIIDKRRDSPNESEVLHVIGEVEGKDIVILDDIVDTSGTLTNAANELKKRGAGHIYAACTHPVLSGPALKRIDDSSLEELIVTDSIPLQNKQSNKIRVLSIAPIIGDAIRGTHEERSISSLFS